MGNDSNVAMNDLLEILAKDCDHPYAINTKKDLIEECHHTMHCREEANVQNAEMPCAREKHSAVSYKNEQLIVFGGCKYEKSANDEMALSDLWLFDVASNEWMQLQTIGVEVSPRHS